MSGGSAFPVVPWEPVWPVRRTSRRAQVTGATVAAVSGLGALLWAIAILGAEPRSFANVLGALGGALLALGAALLVASVSGLLSRRNVGARRRVDPVRGAGVELPMRRTDFPVLIMLAGCALYGFAAWLAWRSGHGGALLPLSKDNSAGATFALIFAISSAVVLLLLMLVLRWKTTVALYPAGIVRRIPLPWQTEKEQLVAWDDIDAITPTQIRPSAQSGPMPSIALEIGRTPIAPRHKLFDTPDALGLPAYLMVAEPNTVLAILRFLHAHPEQRRLLSRADSADWFDAVGAGR